MHVTEARTAVAMWHLCGVMQACVAVVHDSAPNSEASCMCVAFSFQSAGMDICFQHASNPNPIDSSTGLCLRNVCQSKTSTAIAALLFGISVKVSDEDTKQHECLSRI